MPGKPRRGSSEFEGDGGSGLSRMVGLDRRSRQYLEGVGGFLDFAFRNPICSESKFWCHCVKCVNRSKLSREDVYEHLVCNGMLRGYRQWTFHGERIVQNAPSSRHRVEDNYSINVDMHQLLTDAFGCGEDVSMPCPSDSTNTPTHNGKFLYPVRIEKWIMKSTGRKWKDYKCDLKASHFDEHASLKDISSWVYKHIPQHKLLGSRAGTPNHFSGKEHPLAVDKTAGVREMRTSNGDRC
ncbi:hypothetical protein ACMD2_26872 [Ananas comosus]|uniref:Transposase-associated domain-containing protein n=1 Tax=Ananas comosus TaxID=4615 RepID=A0A199VLS8_ANACO|nr:hypothetical protein ACMD2_26872 [Ananas comosus]